MKQTFLYKLSESILSSGIPLEHALIVLPNERARRMLLYELSKRIDKPVFAPTVLSVNQFVSQISPLESLEDAELLAELYAVQQNMTLPMAKDFNDMLAWGPAFLSDVDEIDMQLQDGTYVFKTLAFDKEFSLSMGQDGISQAMQEKMQLYASLAELYVRFRDALLQKKKAYDGLKYRDCAEHIQEYAQALPYSHFVFAGFHVFTPAETNVIRYVKEHFHTQFYFDVDPFYCDFEQSDRFSTAFFLKRIAENLDIPQSQIQFVSNDFSSQQKNVQIVGVSKSMNQIYYAIHVLQQIREEQGTLEDTALVLANEDLLLPFLTAYHAEDANVTMGLPFKYTTAATLLNTLLDMYQTSLRYASAGTELRYFHHRDVVALIQNPLVKNCLFAESSAYQELLLQLDGNQRALYTQQDLPDEYFPAFATTPNDIVVAVKEYVRRLVDRTQGCSKDFVTLSVLLETLENTNGFVQRLYEEGQRISFSTLKYVLGLMTRKLMLPMKGDALHGLQIMGLLETRTLDFKNVIMLSVNEGTLPAGIGFNSLLPFEIKYDARSLPNYLYKDQVYAYHFFRLLQRAENITLIYDQASDGTVVEKSRFISQLEFMAEEKKLENIHFTYPQVNFQFQAKGSDDIVVPKTDAILKDVRGFQFSATALTDYVNCPLQFYIKNICGIQRQNTFQERIENNIIGSVVHDLYQQVFDQIRDCPDDYIRIIDDFLADLETKIDQRMLSDENMQLKESDLQKGRVFMAKRMVLNDVDKYLEKVKEELASGDVKILANELRLSCTLDVEGFPIILKGFVDRLQEQDGCLTVMDYKTGSVKEDKLKVVLAESDRIFKEVEYKQFVQLLFYAILCRKAEHKVLKDVYRSRPMQCAIISIKDVNRNADYIHFAKVETVSDKKAVSQIFDDVILEKMIGHLKDLLKEIINPNLPFEQTKDVQHCACCDFRHICGR